MERQVLARLAMAGLCVDRIRRAGGLRRAGGGTWQQEHASRLVAAPRRGGEATDGSCSTPPPTTDRSWRSPSRSQRPSSRTADASVLHRRDAGRARSRAKHCLRRHGRRAAVPGQRPGRRALLVARHRRPQLDIRVATVTRLTTALSTPRGGRPFGSRHAEAEHDGTSPNFVAIVQANRCRDRRALQMNVPFLLPRSSSRRQRRRSRSAHGGVKPWTSRSGCHRRRDRGCFRRLQRQPAAILQQPAEARRPDSAARFGNEGRLSAERIAEPVRVRMNRGWRASSPSASRTSATRLADSLPRRMSRATRDRAARSSTARGDDVRPGFAEDRMPSATDGPRRQRRQAVGYRRRR